MKKILTIVLLVITAFAFRPSEKKMRIFLIGDSTMADQPTDENPQRGWGQLFPKYFTDEVEIKNFAKNGRSTKSFIAEGRWDSVLNQLQPGDQVLIQFGHNDSKIEDSTRYAAPQTTYKANLTRFINEARSKGANPILLTPVNRRKFDANGKFVDQHGEYPGVVRALAQQLKVSLIDLHKTSQALLEQKGVEGSKNLFLFIPEGHFKKYKGKEEDNTHFTEYGAENIASLVCADIKKQNLEIAKYLKHSDFKEKYAFELPKVYVPHFKLDTFNIVNYGAKSDGVTLNSKAINDAITDAASKGGGTVLIPRGLWSSGPIIMKSNIDLHLEEGAVIVFTADFNEYPLVRSDFEGVVAARCQSPITAEGLTNIAITGKGIFDGNGDAWRPIKKSKMVDGDWKRLIAKGGVVSDDKTWFPSAKALKGYNDKNIGKLDSGKEVKDFEDIKDFLRPNYFRITQCKNVLLDGITVENSPAWNLHILIDENVTVHNVRVKNPWNAQNTDAIDIESSKNVQLEDCIFDTGDDGICIKSGRDAEGRKRGIPTQDVVVNNCLVYHAHGGFVVGSEMSGGAKNLYISNTTFIGTDVGLRFKSTRGRGGVVENIYANNINMKDILGDAVFFDVYYQAKDPVPAAGDNAPPPAIEMKPLDEGTPLFQNFFFRNIVCDGADDGIYIRGLPEMNIKNVVIENAILRSTKGIYCEEATGVSLKNITLLSATTNPVITVQNSGAICFDDIKYKPDADLLLSISGDRTKDIRLLNTDATKAKKQTAFASNVKPTVLTTK